MVNRTSRRIAFAILVSFLLYILSFNFLQVTNLSPRRLLAQTESEINPKVYLPVVSKQEQPTPTPPPTSTPPPTATPAPDIYTGSWTGLTSSTRPITFTVSQDSTQVTLFMLEEKRDGIFCQSPVVAVSGTPVAIVNNEFSGTVQKGSVAKLTFSGRFNSPTTASGEFSLHKWPSDCGWTSSSGTWSANVVP